MGWMGWINIIGKNTHPQCNHFSKIYTPISHSGRQNSLLIPGPAAIFAITVAGQLQLNGEVAHERVLDYLERLENAVMLRAVQNAGSAITTVVPVEDPYFAVEWTNNLQPEIMKMIAPCPPTFD